MDAPQISLIVPVINEAENLPLLLPRVAEALKGRTWEMLIVDDDSTDDTAAVCARLAEQYSVRHLVRHGAKDGLGGAVVHGCSQARGEYLVVMDADLQHPPERLPDLLRPLEEKRAEFVLGSRYVEGGGTYDKWTITRRINSRVATLLAMPFSGRVTDPMSGFFALRRETYARADRLVPLGYKIGLELMCKCRVQGVVEVPIRFAERLHGNSKLSLKEQFRYLEHLSRLYDFKYSRLSPIIKFMIVTVIGFGIWFAVMHAFLAFGAETVTAVMASFAAPVLVEAAFHRRYIRTQKDFLLTRRPWSDFAFIAAMEWVVTWPVVLFAMARLLSPGPDEVLLLAFIAATVTRYVLRKELRHDIRGLRHDPRQFE
jgi:dolichol-phosphate mannosyltransferase